MSAGAAAPVRFHNAALQTGAVRRLRRCARFTQSVRNIARGVGISVRPSHSPLILRPAEMRETLPPLNA